MEDDAHQELLKILEMLNQAINLEQGKMLQVVLNNQAKMVLPAPSAEKTVDEEELAEKEEELAEREKEVAEKEEELAKKEEEAEGEKIEEEKTVEDEEQD